MGSRRTTADRGRVRVPATTAPRSALAPSPARRAFDAGLVQAKLSVGEPGDAFEREADRIADAVTRADRAPAPRACPACTSGDGPCPNCAVTADASRVRRKPAATAAHADAVALPTAMAREVGPGVPLDAATRGHFESRLGHDFSRIRIHASEAAAESARAIDARAFTFGHDLVFGRREYAPGTESGRRLLAHELTHAAQQGAAAPLPALAGSDGEREVMPDATPAIRRWAIEGTRAVADQDGERLEKLARMVDAESECWTCIRPVAMQQDQGSEEAPRPADFDENYRRYVSAGDEFDLSNLGMSTGPSLRITPFETSDLAEPAKLFYPGIAAAPFPDDAIEDGAADGRTPIDELVIFGHAGTAAGRGAMWGDSDANTFVPSELESNRPSWFDKARDGILPRQCWFTRDAVIRAVGCTSMEFAEDFARTYLRDGAQVIATTASVRPRRSNPNGGPLDGLDFASTWEWLSEDQGLATSIAGPFFSVDDFHAASYWATLRFHGLRGWSVGGDRGGAPPAAPAELGATGPAQIGAVQALLDAPVNGEAVRDVLRILQGWGDEGVITAAWDDLGPDRLGRLCRNLEIDHLVEFPLEALASVAALDERTRDRQIRARTRGITTRREAALAFFLVLGLDPADEAALAALLGDDPGRAQRREARIAERIQAALPYEVRIALVEAVAARAEDAVAAEPALASESASASALIVETLSGARVSADEARGAFVAFAALIASASDPEDATARVQATVDRLEELQVMSPWLERLFRASGFDPDQAENAGVLRQVLAARVPAVAEAHVMTLVRADHRSPSIPAEDARLAVRIIEAQPTAMQDAIRRDLTLHANGDLTTRLAEQPRAAAAREAVAAIDWLAELVAAIEAGERMPDELLAALVASGGDQLADHARTLDRVDLVDRLFDRFIAEDIVPYYPELQALVTARDPLENAGSLRRLLSTREPGSVATSIAWQLQLALPPDVRDLVVARDKTLWATLTEHLPPDVAPGSVSRDTSGVLNVGRLVDLAVTHNIVIEADNLADWLGEGAGMFIELAPPEAGAASGMPGTVTLRWRPNDGLVLVSAGVLDLTSADVLLPGTTLRAGAGRLEGLALEYRYAERMAAEQASSLALDLVDLHDIDITTDDGTYHVGHLRLTGAHVAGDLRTGRPAVERILGGPGQAALVDLVSAVFLDMVFSVIDIVEVAVKSGGVGVGAASLATSIVTRYRNRLALQAGARTVLVEDLVVPGVGSVDRFAIGELDPSTEAVAISLTNAVDWNELSALRARWSGGEVLDGEEQARLQALERQVLNLALGVELGPFEARGVRTEVANTAGTDSLKVALDVVSHERTSLKVILDSVEPGKEIPTADGAPATSTPLAALAVLDDGVFASRVEVLHGVIGATTIGLSAEEAAGAGLLAGGGTLDFATGQLVVLPDGSLRFEVKAAAVDEVMVQARALGIDLQVHDLAAAEIGVERLGPSGGATVGFPSGKEGDYVVRFDGIAVNDVDLKIADVLALAPAAPTTSCDAPELLELLDGLRGALIVEADVFIPAPAGAGTVPVTRSIGELVIGRRGGISFVPAGPEGQALALALPAMGIDLSQPHALRAIAGDLYEQYVCAPPAPAPPVATGSASPPTTWAAQVQAWADGAVEAIKQGISATLSAAQTAAVQGLQMTAVRVHDRGLTWRMDAVDLSDVATTLQLDWGGANSVPLDLRLRFVPAPAGPGRLELSLEPFVLDGATGVAKGTPVSIDDLALTRDMHLVVDFGLSGATPVRISAPLDGITVGELRLLLSRT